MVFTQQNGNRYNENYDNELTKLIIIIMNQYLKSYLWKIISLKQLESFYRYR